MSEQSISSLTLGFPILTKKPEELSGSTLIVVRFFSTSIVAKEICHCDGFAMESAGTWMALSQVKQCPSHLHQLFVAQQEIGVLSQK